MKEAINSIKKYIPAEKISWTGPMCGHLNWMKLLSKPIENTENYYIKYGVIIVDGSNYFRKAQTNNYIKISTSVENEKEIEEGIIRIGRQWRINMMKTPEFFLLLSQMYSVLYPPATPKMKY